MTEELNFQMFRSYGQLLLHWIPKQSDTIIKFFYTQSQSAKEKRLVRIRVKVQGEKGVHNKYCTQQIKQLYFNANCKTKHTGSNLNTQNQRNK